jgi:hypothetical protein
MLDDSELYPRYAELVSTIGQVATTSNSPQDLKASLRSDPHFMQLRHSVTAEIQALYARVAVAFPMPAISLYFGLQFKTPLKEVALQQRSVTREIRLYLFIPPTANCMMWRGRNLRPPGVRHLTEAFAHECAHILDFHRRGHSNHDQHFDSCFAEILSFVRLESDGNSRSSSS